MIPLSVGFLLMVLVIALCFWQTTLYRQQAAYVYGFGTASHFLIFEYMKLSGISYPWVFDYTIGALISSVIITTLQNLSTYTKFHRRLQWIALASIAANGVGVLVQYLEFDIIIYQGLALTLLLVLIGELSRNGRHFEISRDSGLFGHLRWPVI